ncbi:DNA polymerase III subunit gamma/tau [Microbacterium sp. 4R-513]|uniref:DNA polymerase III subunit gamma/tau n=1 Tax=Microbacterium sp. 4R-513 TaxID=2567934 RepID=UPI0013E13946|nr:DNA polymerase III subunit gamma/tau [Microbacterium sp. 4R-513]QIG40398.1 DNA polymerase III subunit gamma/tau [Microbacterium sp. 4R-513]
MTAGRDDDALTWDGDDDPTLDVGATRDDEIETDAASSLPVTGTSLPAGYRAVGKGSESLAPAAGERDEATSVITSDDMDAEPRAMGNAALIGIGIFAGVYLLLTLGWLLGAARLQLVAQLFLEPIAFQITLWLAVLALPLWFATVFWLTRGGRAWLRFTLLAAGAVLLIPWPFVLAGAFL